MTRRHREVVVSTIVVSPTTKVGGGVTTTYSYDRTDELYQQVIGGTSKAFASDTFGNLVSGYDAGSAQTSYAYDAANRLTDDHPAGRVPGDLRPRRPRSPADPDRRHRGRLIRLCGHECDDLRDRPDGGPDRRPPRRGRQPARRQDRWWR